MLLKRYADRQACVEHVTLADWAAWYDSCNKKQYTKRTNKQDIDLLPLETLDNEVNDDDHDSDDSLGQSIFNLQYFTTTVIVNIVN